MAKPDDLQSAAGMGPDPLQGVPISRPLAATISISRKVNLGKYESADAFISVNGITEKTTDLEVIELLDGPVKQTFDILKARLLVQVQALRKGEGDHGSGY